MPLTYEKSLVHLAEDLYNTSGIVDYISVSGQLTSATFDGSVTAPVTSGTAISTITSTGLTSDDMVLGISLPAAIASHASVVLENAWCSANSVRVRFTGNAATALSLTGLTFTFFIAKRS